MILLFWMVYYFDYGSSRWVCSMAPWQPCPKDIIIADCLILVFNQTHNSGGGATHTFFMEHPPFIAAKHVFGAQPAMDWWYVAGWNQRMATRGTTGGTRMANREKPLRKSGVCGERMCVFCLCLINIYIYIYCIWDDVPQSLWFSRGFFMRPTNKLWCLADLKFLTKIPTFLRRRKEIHVTYCYQLSMTSAVVADDPFLSLIHFPISTHYAMPVFSMHQHVCLWSHHFATSLFVVPQFLLITIGPVVSLRLAILSWWIVFVA